MSFVIYSIAWFVLPPNVILHYDTRLFCSHHCNRNIFIEIWTVVTSVFLLLLLLLDLRVTVPYRTFKYSILFFQYPLPPLGTPSAGKHVAKLLNEETSFVPFCWCRTFSSTGSSNALCNFRGTLCEILFLLSKHQLIFLLLLINEIYTSHATSSVKILHRNAFSLVRRDTCCNCILDFFPRKHYCTRGN